MKKWDKVNKANLAIALTVAIVGFSFALLISILVPGEDVKAHIVRLFALMPLFLGVDLIVEELKKDKHK